MGLHIHIIIRLFIHVDSFHEKRTDWPKERIPDFTLHASNRLQPLLSNPILSGGKGNSSKKKKKNSAPDPLGRKSSDDRKKSSSLDSSISSRNPTPVSPLSSTF